MKVSFLVTYYNQEQYVRQSMDSLLAIEKPEEWEIIVGDDGSTDGTVDIVNEYIRNDPEHIRLYVMPREAEKKYNAEKRVCANRLNILEHCSGDCFCMLDGDDFYFDTKFVLEAVNVLENHDEVSVVSFGHRYFQDGEFGKEVLLPPGIGPHVDTQLYIKILYIHFGAGVHRLRWEKGRIEHIRKIGFFGDDAIMINSLNYGKMYNIRRSIYAYRQTGEGIYLRMQQIEKAVAEILGCDIKKMIIDQSNCLNERSRQSILTVYAWRNKVQSALGNSKFNQYVEECRKIDNMIPNAISYKLLVYGSLNKSEKREVKRAVLQAVFQVMCDLPKRLFFKTLKILFKSKKVDS